MEKASNAPLKQIFYEIFRKNCENDLEEFSANFDDLASSFFSADKVIEDKLKSCSTKNINFDMTTDLENNLRQISQEIVKSRIENTLNDAIDTGKGRKSVYVSEKFQKYAECVNLEFTDNGLSSKFLELFAIIKSKDFSHRTKLVQSVFDELEFIQQELKLCHDHHIPNNISLKEQDDYKLLKTLMVDDDMIDQLTASLANVGEVVFLIYF